MLNGRLKVLVIIDPVFAPQLFAQQLAQKVRMPASDIHLGADVRDATRHHAGEAYSTVILGFNTNTQPQLLRLQTEELHQKFPGAFVIHYGPYDLGCENLGAEAFVSFTDSERLIALIRHSSETPHPEKR